MLATFWQQISSNSSTLDVLRHPTAKIFTADSQAADGQAVDSLAADTRSRHSQQTCHRRLPAADHPTGDESPTVADGFKAEVTSKLTL